MNQSTYALAASMINQINRIDTISNNLANVNTNGFKQERTSEGSFNYYLKRAQEERFIPAKISEISNTIPKMDYKYTVTKQGPLMITGNNLDFTLSSEDTFFKIEGENGQTLYTRDGSFKSLDGFLVNSSGRNVLSNDNEAIEINEGFENQIGVTKIKFKNLSKIGDNNYKVNEQANIENLELNDKEIIQGAIEKSNVNTVLSMVGLIDAQRSLEQAQKAVNTIDEINQRLIDRVGNNS